MAYYTHDELMHLKSFEGKTLDKVNYYVWVNGVQEEILTFTLWAALHFQDGSVLTLHTPEDSRRLTFPTDVDYDKEMAEAAIPGQRVGLMQHDVSGSEFWGPVIGRQLRAIELEREGEGLYAADILLLNFIEERQIIVEPDAEEGLNIYIEQPPIT